jgi:hypothetical protein
MEGILGLPIVPPRDGKQYCLAKTKKSGGQIQCGSVVSKRNQEKAWYLLRECVSCSDLDDQAVACYTKQLCELLIHSRHAEQRKLNMDHWNLKIWEFRNDPRNRMACRDPARPLDQQPRPPRRVPHHDSILPDAIHDRVEPEEIAISNADVEISEDAIVERYRSLETDQSRSVSTNESMEEISTSPSSPMSHSSHQLSGHNATVYSPITLSSCILGLWMQFGAVCGLRIQVGKSYSSQNSRDGLLLVKFEVGILENVVPLLLGILLMSLMFVLLGGTHN